MANHDNDFVDINSSSQVNKLYKKRNRKGRVRRTVALLLSLLCLIVGSGMVYYYVALDSLNYQEIDNEAAPTSATSTSQVDTIDQESLLSDTKVLNILLFGQDAHGSGENDKYGRSDTIILLSLDNRHKKIKMTSFQRDTFVAIPGMNDNKLNSAFSLGGVKLSIAMIEANFGIHVDKYACVDFDSFRKIIKVLDGVDIELNLEEIEYINAQIDVNNQLGKTQFLEYDPTKEKQMIHLDGYQALWYARDRGEEALGGNPNYSFSGDDWDRTARQRNLLSVVVRDLKENATVTDIVEIVNNIGPLITTNLKKNDITYLVSNVMTYLDYEIEQSSQPIEGTWKYAKTEDGQSVILITDWDKVRYNLAQFIYEDSLSSNQTP